MCIIIIMRQTFKKAFCTDVANSKSQNGALIEFSDDGFCEG